MFDNPVFVVILLVVVAALGAAAGFFAGRSKGQEMARDAKTADLNEAKAQIEADRQEISELSTAVTQYRTQAEGLAQQLTYLKSQLAQAQRAEQERVERERERAAAEAERKQVTAGASYRIDSVTLNSLNPIVGQTLVASVAPYGATATITWYRDDSKILSYGATYTVQADDIGYSIYVWAEGTGNTTGSATSKITSEVKAN